MEFYKVCRNCKHSKTDSRLIITCHRYPPQILADPKGSTNEYGSSYITAPSVCFPKVQGGYTCGEWVGNTLSLRIKSMFSTK
jgi:hypothetical protein